MAGFCLFVVQQIYFYLQQFWFGSLESFLNLLGFVWEVYSHNGQWPHQVKRKKTEKRTRRKNKYQCLNLFHWNFATAPLSVFIAMSSEGQLGFLFSALRWQTPASFVRGKPKLLEIESIYYVELKNCHSVPIIFFPCYTVTVIRCKSNNYYHFLFKHFFCKGMWGYLHCTQTLLL